MIEPLKFTDVGSYEEFATMEMERLCEKVQQLNLDIVGLKIKNTQLEAEVERLQKDLEFYLPSV